MARAGSATPGAAAGWISAQKEPDMVIPLAASPGCVNLESMRSTAADFRYALRTLRASPGFTFVAILLIALGVGANTTIFSVIEAIVLRPLPYRDPSRLCMLWKSVPA